jgi:3D (Asp-Asp-Asp) domain-containing protein
MWKARYRQSLMLGAGLFIYLACSQESWYRHSATVTASAYNSLPGQTEGEPNVAAWGDELEPGMKAIAVSRDLIDRGLTRGVEVKIEGLRGTYRVMDRMHGRWTEKIDIYMGTDRKAAKEWGRRRVTIYWN